MRELNDICDLVGEAYLAGWQDSQEWDHPVHGTQLDKIIDDYMDGEEVRENVAGILEAFLEFGAVEMQAVISNKLNEALGK